VFIKNGLYISIHKKKLTCYKLALKFRKALHFFDIKGWPSQTSFKIRNKYSYA